MNKKLIFALLFVLVTVQFACAVDTVIKINTLSNHDVRLTFINPDASELGENITIETKRVNSGESGEISVPFSTTKNNFNLAYAVMNNGSAIISNIVKDINSGENLYLLLIPGAVQVTKNYVEPVVVVETPVEVENETIPANESASISGNVVVNETTSSNETSKNSFWGFLKLFRISGFASSDEKDSSSGNLFYYGILVLILAAVFVFVFMKVRKKNAIDGINNLQLRKFSNDEEELQDAKEKIFEAEREIKDVKSRRSGYPEN